MQDRHPPIRDDQFEEHLDGTMPESEQASFEERLGAHEDRLAEAELQGRIDRTLCKLFPHALADEAHVRALVDRDAARARRARRVARRVAVVAAAAAVLAVALWRTLPVAQRPTPYFTRAPLAQVYRDTVQGGFEPYYECREPDRFADTFASRQGAPLQLLPMPDGARMLGLSYPGGLSRNTTAMLCIVDGEPVMVFVDRLAADTDIALATRVDEPGVNVFRETRDGLVFYEVSPFQSPRVMDLMAKASTGRSQE